MENLFPYQRDRKVYGDILDAGGISDGELYAVVKLLSQKHSIHVLDSLLHRREEENYWFFHSHTFSH